MSTLPKPDRTPELDVEDARRRMLETAEEAKRLEDAGEGWAANEMWELYLGIEAAIAAQARSARAAERWAARQAR
ncbi:MAG: hypothetical protein ACHQHO_13075 [Solirubrobacterales bacterium]